MKDVDKIINSIAKKYAKYAEKKGIMIGDLKQVGYTGYLEGIDQFDPERGMSENSYIYFLVRNKVDRFVNKGIYCNYIIAGEETNANEIEDFSINLEAAVYLKQVNKRIKKLDKRSRSVLLYKVEGYSDREVGLKIGCSKRNATVIKNKSIKLITSVED